MIRQAPGERLGPYELVALVGTGGMGAVWKARDTRLDRVVALKFSTSGFTQAFAREANAIAALNHPHICQLYDVGPDYLVMEFVDGRPLRGPLALDVTLRYAGQILDALHAAHAKGIVHRDLKPANILVTRSSIKLLDFGIAKTLFSGNPAQTQTATLTGEVVGTLEYMSPEQLRGEAVDTRSDLFSFGCVLYEMLSGRRAFGAPSQANVISAVLTGEPPPLKVHDGIARVVSTCLAKDREQRFQTALDLKRNLEWSVEPLRSSPAPRSKVTPLLALTCLALASAVLALFLLRDKAASPVDYVAARLTYDSGLTTDPAITADGKLIAFASDRSGEDHLDLYVQQTAGGPAVRLTTTPGDDHEPAFSPDGSTIVFRSERAGGGLFTVPALGGEARRLTRNGHDPRFSPGGRFIVFTTAKSGQGSLSGLSYVIPIEGGQPSPISPDFRSAIRPVWVNERTVLFLGVARGESTQSWWTTDVEKVSPVPTSLVPATAQYASVDHTSRQLLYFVADAGDLGVMWMMPFDPNTAKAAGDPRQVLAGIGGELNISAGNGAVASALTTGSVNVWWLPLAGEKEAPTQLTFDAALKAVPDISPDGRYLAYSSRRSGNSDVYLRDLTTGRESPVTVSPLTENYPQFTAGGAEVAFASYGTGTAESSVFAYAINGGITRLIAQPPFGRFDQVSEDGRFVMWHGGPDPALRILDLSTGRAEVVIRATPKNVYQPRISRDGQWISFVVKSNETDSRIYAARFRGTQPIAPSEWLPLTTGGAGDDKPRLTPDRQRLYFTSLADGHRCVWVQQLDPVAMRPIGEATAVYHSHTARRSLIRVPESAQEIAIAGARLFFNMAETTGNIWLLRPRMSEPPREQRVY